MRGWGLPRTILEGKRVPLGSDPACTPMVVSHSYIPIPGPLHETGVNRWVSMT